MTTSRSLPRSSRRLSAVAAVVAIGLAGCAGTGIDAQTNAQYQPGIGSNVRTGSIQLFNALAVDNGDGTATFSAAILNRGDKPAKLTGAAAKSSDGAKIEVTTAPAIVGSGKMFNTGKAGAVLLSDKKLTAGDYVTLSLRFDGGRKVRVEAPVVARTAIYDEVATGPGGEMPTKESPSVTPAPAEAPGAH